MSNARGSGRGSGSSTTANDAANPSLRDATQASGSGSGTDSGSSGCNFATTVDFGYNGYMSTVEEVNCAPPIIQVPIIVGNPGSCPVTVSYSTQDGTAIASVDYTAVSGSASFPAYSTGPYWVDIPILDDGTDESVGSEVFYVNLSNPVNATIGGDNPFAVYIEEGPQQAATDTLRWNPCIDNNASTVQNWYDVTQGFQLEKGALGANPSSPIQFDANSADTPNSNAPITWDKSFTVASISVQGGYNAVQTVNYGVGLEMDGANGTTLTVDESSEAEYELEGNNNLQTDTGDAEIDGTMFVNFLAGGSVRTINGTTETVNGNIDYGTGGKVNIINGGTLNLANGFLSTQSSGSPITESSTRKDSLCW